MNAKQTLHVRVGEAPQQALARVAEAMQAIDRGQSAAARFELGFENMQQLLSVFTAKRWDLLGMLRQTGPSSIMALARKLGRDYKNVYADVRVLLEWGVLEKTPQQRIQAPFDEITVEVQLPQRLAA